MDVCTTSGSSWQDRRGETLAVGAGMRSGEAPVDIGLLDIAVVHPGGDLAYKCVLVGNAAVQALTSEHAQLRLGHVEPTPVLGREMDLQLVRQPLGFGRRERLIQ